MTKNNKAILVGILSAITVLVVSKLTVNMWLNAIIVAIIVFIGEKLIDKKL